MPCYVSIRNWLAVLAVSSALFCPLTKLHAVSSEPNDDGLRPCAEPLFALTIPEEALDVRFALTFDNATEGFGKIVEYDGVTVAVCYHDGVWNFFCGTTGGYDSTGSKMLAWGILSPDEEVLVDYVPVVGRGAYLIFVGGQLIGLCPSSLDASSGAMSFWNVDFAELCFGAVSYEVAYPQYVVDAMMDHGYSESEIRALLGLDSLSGYELATDTQPASTKDTSTLEASAASGGTDFPESGGDDSPIIVLNSGECVQVNKGDMTTR